MNTLITKITDWLKVARYSQTVWMIALAVVAFLFFIMLFSFIRSVKKRKNKVDEVKPQAQPEEPDILEGYNGEILPALPRFAPSPEDRPAPEPTLSPAHATAPQQPETVSETISDESDEDCYGDYEDNYEYRDQQRVRHESREYHHEYGRNYPQVIQQTYRNKDDLIASLAAERASLAAEKAALAAEKAAFSVSKAERFSYRPQQPYGYDDYAMHSKVSELERLERERIERLERERIERLERERIERERAERERTERLERERFERLERERADMLERERLAQEQEKRMFIEQNQRIMAERNQLLEQERDKNIQLEKQINELKQEMARFEQSILAREQERFNAERERAQREKLEQERLEQERLERERLDAERERQEKERLEKERLEKERLEKERLEKEEKERLEKERLEQEEKERLEQEEKKRLEKEEKERLEQEEQQKQEIDSNQAEQERLAKEIALMEQQRREIEEQRRELEQLEKERAEREIIERKKLEEELALLAQQAEIAQYEKANEKVARSEEIENKEEPDPNYLDTKESDNAECVNKNKPNIDDDDDGDDDDDNDDGDDNDDNDGDDNGENSTKNPDYDKFAALDALPRLPKKPFAEKLKEQTEQSKFLYSRLKNELLSYKDMKSRLTSKVESFNLKRIQIAKIGLSGKVIRVYLALNPAEMDEAIYKHKDVSHKRRFQYTPMMLKLKTEQDLANILDLVLEIMHQNDFPKRKKFTTTDYVKELRDTQNAPLTKLNATYTIADIADADTVAGISDYDAMSCVTIQDSKPINELKSQSISVGQISQAYKSGEKVDIKSLKKRGLIAKTTNYIEITGEGVLDKVLTTVSNAYDIDAIKIILSLGGTPIYLKEKEA